MTKKFDQETKTLRDCDEIHETFTNELEQQRTRRVAAIDMPLVHIPAVHADGTMDGIKECRSDEQNIGTYCRFLTIANAEFDASEVSALEAKFPALDVVNSAKCWNRWKKSSVVRIKRLPTELRDELKSEYHRTECFFQHTFLECKVCAFAINTDKRYSQNWVPGYKKKGAKSNPKKRASSQRNKTTLSEHELLARKDQELRNAHFKSVNVLLRYGCALSKRTFAILNKLVFFDPTISAAARKRKTPGTVTIFFKDKDVKVPLNSDKLVELLHKTFPGASNAEEVNWSHLAEGALFPLFFL